MKIPKELIKEFVRGENFKNTNDILTSIKSMFGDDSLRKMLYLASVNIRKKWTARYKNWDIIISQLEILQNKSA